MERLKRLLRFLRPKVYLQADEPEADLALRLPLKDSLARGLGFAPDLLRSYRRLFHRFLRRLRRGNRRVRRIRRGDRIINQQAGRNYRLVPFRSGVNLLAPVPTVLRAVEQGRMSLRTGGIPSAAGDPREGGEGSAEGKGRSRPAPGDTGCRAVAGRGVRAGSRPGLRLADLRGWDKVEHESLTLILLVDVSRSSLGHLRMFADVLESLAGHFHRNRDRMGLIAIQGMQAKVLNHPTHNYRVVTRCLTGLKVQGYSPLGDGLLKALSTARLERFRNPGSRSVVVLLSDCFPEPVTGRYPTLMEEPVYRQAVGAAQLYRRDKVGLLVVQPVRRRGDGLARPQVPAGEELAQALVHVSGGRLIRFEAGETGGRASKRHLEMMLGEIESAFQGGARAGQDRDAFGPGALFGSQVR